MLQAITESTCVKTHLYALSCACLVPAIMLDTYLCGSAKIRVRSEEYLV